MARLARSFGLGLLLCAACRQSPPPPPSAPDWCAGRARCTVTRHRFSAPHGSHEVVDLRIAHAPGAEADEDRCDRREYWLVSAPRPVLLAADCETQWGADNPGPADTRLDGEQLQVHYQELDSNDVCIIVDATLSLGQRRVTSQRRRQGTYEQHECRREQADEAAPGGDGSAEKPLLTLHR